MAGPAELDAGSEEVDEDRSKQLVQDAVVYLSSDPAGKRKRGNVHLSLAVENVERHARTWGLQSDDIVSLVDVAGNIAWGEAISVRLVKSLIPASRVPEEAVVKAVSWMCTNIPSSNLQSVFLRWILLILDLLDETEKLHSLYGFLFYFIENETLCQHVCHLLYLLTKKEDVRLFRVRHLLALQQKMGSQPYILGLLSLYKLYHPSLVSIALPRTQKTFFRQYDHAWKAKIQKVQSNRVDQRESDNVQQSLLANPFNLSASTKSSKAAKRDCVPEIYSASTTSSTDETCTTKLLSLNQVKDFQHLLQCLDRLEVPSQVGAVLRNVALQHMLSCQGDTVMVARLSYWLSQLLYEEFFTNQETNSKLVNRKENLLQLLIYLTDFLQEGIPVVDNFLCKYLYTWDGVDFRPYILKLVSRIGLIPFETLNDLLLEPLRKHFFTSSVYFKCQLIVSLTELLRNYVHVELPRYRAGVQLISDQQLTSSMVADSNWYSVFSNEVTEFNAGHCITELARFTHQLCLLGLQAENYNSLMFSYCLSFAEMMSTMQKSYECPCISLPQKNFVYMGLFSNNAMVLSRTCSLLCSYRGEFQLLRGLLSAGKLKNTETVSKSLKQISEFNPFLLDVSDCLWRCKAFAGVQDNSVFHGVNRQDIEKLHLGITSPNERFSLHHHQALIGFAYSFLKLTQGPGKKVHPALIKEHKDVYMEYLDREEISGVVEFIHTFIKKYTKK